MNSLFSLRAHAARKSLHVLGLQCCAAAEIAAVRSPRGGVLYVNFQVADKAHLRDLNFEVGDRRLNRFECNTAERLMPTNLSGLRKSAVAAECLRRCLHAWHYSAAVPMVSREAIGRVGLPASAIGRSLLRGAYAETVRNKAEACGLRVEWRRHCRTKAASRRTVCTVCPELG